MNDFLIIDTRGDDEYDLSHVNGAINIPPEEFLTGKLPQKLSDVDKNKPIIVYCRSGQRANTCMMFLRQHGFTSITNGINEMRVSSILKSQ